MEIRLLKEGEEDRMIFLLQQVFDGWHDRRYWNWLYKENPAGKPSIGVAVDKDQVVASYSVCPVRLRAGTTQFTAGFALDAATDPRYRRRGLFSKVAMAAFGDAEHRGFRCIMGYSEWGGPAAQGQVAKLGFRRIFAVKRLVKVVSWPKVFAFKLNLPVHPPAVEEVTNQIKAVLEERDNLGISILSRRDVNGSMLTTGKDDSILVNKSPEHVQWRYFDHPERRYLLLASNSHSSSPAFFALTLRREKRITVGVIVDVFGNRDEWKAMLNGIESLMRLSGVTLLEAYVSEAHRALPMMTSLAYRGRAFSLVGIVRPTANVPSYDEQLTSRTEAWETTIADDPSL